MLTPSLFKDSFLVGKSLKCKGSHQCQKTNNFLILRKVLPIISVSQGNKTAVDPNGQNRVLKATPNNIKKKRGGGRKNPLSTLLSELP